VVFRFSHLGLQSVELRPFLTNLWCRIQTLACRKNALVHLTSPHNRWAPTHRRHMFQRKRRDTLVSTIERQYGIDLHARADMKLSGLLRDRGFESLTRLLTAYRGRSTRHGSPRSVFLSFHAEDLRRVAGFRLMTDNPRVALDLNEEATRQPVKSERSRYVRQALRERIRAVEVMVCLIGNGTAWRGWVDWELETAWSLHKGLCGVRIRETFGKTPSVLSKVEAPIAPWTTEAIVAAIECAAARRS